MENSTELNKALKEEINKIFTDLLKEIGNSRQQLFNKVLNFHTEVHKELSKSKIDANREKEIRNEVSRTVKMAHQQLPHLRLNTPKLTPAPVKAPTEAKAKPEPKPKPEPKAKPEPKSKSESKGKPAAKSAPAKKKK